MQLPKVVLRDLTLDDVEDRFHWSLDREVTAYLNVPDKYPPFTKEETKLWIEACINRSNGYIQKAITTEDGNHIGWVDLKNIEQADKSAEIGIAIGDKQFWGKGYGSSALRAMLSVGFREWELNKIWLRVDVDNEKAIRSYRLNGFQEEEFMHQDRWRNGISVDRLRMAIWRKDFELSVIDQ